jgi:hypothetical protein
VFTVTSLYGPLGDMVKGYKRGGILGLYTL